MKKILFVASECVPFIKQEVLQMCAVHFLKSLTRTIGM